MTGLGLKKGGSALECEEWTDFVNGLSHKVISHCQENHRWRKRKYATLRREIHFPQITHGDKQ